MMQDNVVNIPVSHLTIFLTPKPSSSSSSSSSSSISSSSSATSKSVTPISKKEEEIFIESNAENYSEYIHNSDRTIARAKILSAAAKQNEKIIDEYNLDCLRCSTIGRATVKQSDSTTIEIEFNVEETVKVNRRFVGDAGTHQWQLFQSVTKDGAFEINEEDYVVVLGILRDKVIMEVPNHVPSTSESKKIKTYLISSEYFFPQDMHLSPESL